MDEVVISANNWTLEEFIEKIQSDSSFYQAFINLKYYPHEVAGDMILMDRKGEVEDELELTAIQQLVDSERVVEVIEEKGGEKMKNRKGEFDYITCEMFDRVFFPDFQETVSTSIASLEQKEEKGSKIDRYKSQIKKMMFNPGSEISSLPFVGDKLDIFSSDMVPYYDYSASSGYTEDSVYCYVFEVKAKEEVKESKTVIKSMKSYFDKVNMQVLFRNYHLAFSNAFIDFDITMKVKNSWLDGVLVPALINYEGHWNIPFKKEEWVNFTVINTNWKILKN